MSLLAGIFSDFYASRDNVLARLDARTKLLIALMLLAAVVFSSAPALPFAVALLCIGAAAALGVPARLLVLRLAVPLGFAAMLLALQTFLTGGAPLWSARMGTLALTATREGLHHGILLASRVLGGVSVVVLLGSVTPAHRIFGAMRALGVPGGWVEIAMLVYRYTFVLFDLCGDVMAAQKTRLGYAGLRQGLASAGALGGTVLLRAMDQAERTHEAMYVRGYNGGIPFGPLPPFSRRDLAIIAGAAFTTGFLFHAAEALCR